MKLFHRKPRPTDAPQAIQAQKDSEDRKKLIEAQSRLLEERLKGAQKLREKNHIYDAVLRTIGGTR